MKLPSNDGSLFDLGWLFLREEPATSFTTVTFALLDIGKAWKVQISVVGTGTSTTSSKWLGDACTSAREVETTKGGWIKTTTAAGLDCLELVFDGGELYFKPARANWLKHDVKDTSFRPQDSLGSTGEDVASWGVWWTVN